MAREDLRNDEDRIRRDLNWRSRNLRHQMDKHARETKSSLQTEADTKKREIKHEAIAARQTAGLGGGSHGGSERSDQSRLDRDDTIYRATAYAAGVGAVLGALVLGVGHLAALFFAGGWPRYELGDIPEVLWGVVRNPGDPGAAWEPVNRGAELPGPLGWWSVFVVVVLILGALGFLGYAIWSTRATAVPGATTPVPRGGHRHLRVRKGGEGRLVVGTSGRWKLAVDSLHSLLVVGPAHSGKTSGLAIPALLEWNGPAVVASTKGHLMEETIGWRSHQGEVHVFDPAAVSRFHRSGWALLHDCGTWQGAIRTARHLTIAAKATFGGQIDGGAMDRIEHGAMWTSAMAMSLAPYLYAAAAEGRPILDAAEWIEREERDEVLEVLRGIDRTAAHAHETTFFRDDPSRSTFFHYMYQVLSVYGDPTVAASSARHEIVAEELLDGGSNTLYLTAPEHDQIRFQPLFATIVRQMLTAVSDRFASEGRPLDPPLLLLIDEAVGIASVDEMAAVASSGAAQGVQVVSIFEDLSRFERLQPNASELVARAHRAKLVLPGAYQGPAGTSIEALLPAVQARQLAENEGALRYGGAPPVRVRLRRWYQDAELRRRVETQQDVVAPTEARPTVPRGRSPIENAPPYHLVEQAGAWRRRRHRDHDRDDDNGDERDHGRDRDRDRDRRLVPGVLTTSPEGESLPDNVRPLSPRDRHRR